MNYNNLKIQNCKNKYRKIFSKLIIFNNKTNKFKYNIRNLN